MTQETHTILPDCRFLYLTKNTYQGIAIHSLLTESRNTESFYLNNLEVTPFFLIDTYSKFISFPLPIDNVRNINENAAELDIILSVKRPGRRRLRFCDILFFADRHNRNQVSFLFINQQDTVEEIRKKMDVFSTHCKATVSGNKKQQCTSFYFTRQEQQIVFYMVAGMKMKEIAQVLNVRNQRVYYWREQLISKLEQHQSFSLFQRLSLCGTISPVQKNISDDENYIYQTKY